MSWAKRSLTIAVNSVAKGDRKRWTVSLMNSMLAEGVEVPNKTFLREP